MKTSKISLPWTCPACGSDIGLEAEAAITFADRSVGIMNPYVDEFGGILVCIHCGANPGEGFFERLAEKYLDGDDGGPYGGDGKDD